ncbi:UDP-glucosyltransferase 2-like isoform X1 [Pieris napi]|uniref:UDP-glucosyltransferase 2-like isoform X1 n=1 Tax=Pieris napi TaxID=78633 RepID=UPI001FB939E6|nr:UDP-glucosyltransferase 2-like isoform X1 [Pieris napi]
MANLILFFVVISAWNFTESARILGVFPTPSISHQVVFRPIMHALAKRGHDVVVITPDPAFPKGKAPPNLTEIDVHNESYIHIDKLLSVNRGRKNDFITQFTKILEGMPIIFESQLQVPEVQKVLKDETDSFDLVFIESCVRAALAISHVIKAPVIQISSLGISAPQYALAGAPIQPFVYPSPLQQRIYNLSLLEKLKELLSFQKIIRHIYATDHLDYNLAKKYFGDIPQFEELFTNTKMLFINEHPLWADNRPVPPNILYIGGVHEVPEKPLPNPLKTYLDSSKNGVIYISFGTNVRANMLCPEKIKVMVNVLSKLQYDVLWKWDNETLINKSENIVISKWFPQSDLLKHPKVKLFITQGGLQSTDEAINAAVPLLGVPLLADQWYNVEKYVRHRIGVQIDFETLTHEEFKNAIDSVINDSSYKENIIRLRSIMRDQPMKPLDQAIYWTEHILKHGGDHLQPPNFGVYGIFEYYEIPLVLTISFCLFIVVYLFVWILVILLRVLRKLIFGKVKTN